MIRNLLTIGFFTDQSGSQTDSVETSESVEPIKDEKPHNYYEVFVPSDISGTSEEPYISTIIITITNK